MQEVQNHNNVPTITSLVVAGNPNKKVQVENNSNGSTHLDELNQRIDEIENAIGQDNSDPIGRAFAIRAESNKITKSELTLNAKTEIKKTDNINLI